MYVYMLQLSWHVQFLMAFSCVNGLSLISINRRDEIYIYIYNAYICSIYMLSFACTLTVHGRHISC